VFLDVVWEKFAVFVEVHGVQHLEPEAWLQDALKQNAATMAGLAVLRIPALALRLDPEPFLARVAAALAAGGWCGRA
jgi:very-short-patch-repair endonuclease